MPMLTDEKQMRSALQLAAQNPFEGVDPGFIERFKSDYAGMHEAKNSNARDLIVNEIQRDFMSQFYKESGQQLQAWITPKAGVLGPADFSPDEGLEASARGMFDAWKKQNPQSALTFPDRDFIDKEAVRRGAATISSGKTLERRSTGFGSTAGGFAGTMVGAMTDPINAVSVLFGAGAASGVLRTALIEGGIGMASEGVIQGLNYDWRKQVEPDYSLSDALGEVAAAGAGGAILGGGIKGLAAAWQRAKTGSWPSHVKDTAYVVTREAAIPSSRFEQSVQGAAAHQAALTKSLDDLIQSRPVELPPEAFVQANARPGRVYDADGNSVGVRYEVVDADSLITSNRDDLSINPDFPQELQPRDRSRAMSQDQISGIAANLQPERLGFSSDASTGAPVVGPDGLVESGNGRVLALRRAYQQGGIPSENYLNYLRSQNFDVEGIRNPVLVARRVTDLEDRVAFVTAANRSTAMRLGAAEQALSDARLLDGDLLSRLEGSDIKAAGNQAFTRGFMQKLPRAEQGNLIDKDGFLSQEGERRISAALMGRAYGEPAMLSRALEDTDNNIKGIAGALSDSSAPWSMMRDAVARGDIPAGMDITDDLLNAVRLVMKARDEGRAVRDVVNQGEMFGGPDELSKIVARAMFSDADLKRPVGRARLAEFLRDYATEAMKNDAGPRLFGDALGSADILKSSLERVGRNDLMRVAEERLTPENIQKLYDSPETAEVAIMDAERLIADREELSVAERNRMARAKEQGFTIEGFHGTGAVFDDFSADYLGSNTGAESASKGFFFASNPETSHAYLRELGSDYFIDPETVDHQALSMMPAAVKKDVREVWDIAEKMRQTDDDVEYDQLALRHDELTARIDAAAEAFREQFEAGNNIRPVLLRMQNPFEFDMKGNPEREITFADLIDQAKAAGHDGLIIRNTFDGGPLDDIKVVFSPDQIRSRFDQFEATGKPTVNPEPPPSSEPVMIDLGDGRGARDLNDILREADDEIAAAKDIEACTIGRDAGE